MTDIVNGREKKTLHVEIPFAYHVWKTPVSRDAPPQETTGVARKTITLPVWVYALARRVLGESLYMRMKSAARRGK